MKTTRILIVLLGLCCLPLAAKAQTDDSKYLAGAVPEVNGKVVFSKEFNIPGMKQQEVFERSLGWMQQRLAQNQNNSRVVLQEAGKGQVVGVSDEWMVFASTALSLDRTRILYQLFVTCADEHCRLEVSKVNYIYREGKERYSAEEWIVDKYALNKDHTKLIRGLAKWRRHTVDLVDGLCLSLADALSAAPALPKEETAQAAEAPKAEKSVAASGTMTIVQKNQVNIAPAQTPAVAPAPDEKMKAAAPIEGGMAACGGLHPKDPNRMVKAGSLKLTDGRFVIVIGSDPFNMTMMTPGAGGSIGTYQGKQVVFTILSPDQPHDLLDRAETYEVRFYPNGSNEPSHVFKCRKAEAPAPVEGMPRTYIGEICD